jgi:DedD protein
MERKKLTWIVITVGLALIVLLTLCYFWLRPGRKTGQNEPVSLSVQASPKNPNAEAYPAPESLSATPSPQVSFGDSLIGYGQDGTSASPTPEATPTIPDTSVLNQPAATAAPASDGKSPTSPNGPKTEKPKAGSAHTAQRAVAPSAPPKKIRVTEYWIQVASFKSRGKADDLRSSLQKQGLQAVITTKDIDGSTYYRVRVGSFAGSAEAQTWLVKIRKQPGCAEAYVSKTSALR